MQLLAYSTLWEEGGRASHARTCLRKQAHTHLYLGPCVTNVSDSPITPCVQWFILYTSYLSVWGVRRERGGGVEGRGEGGKVEGGVGREGEGRGGWGRTGKGRERRKEEKGGR